MQEFFEMNVCMCRLLFPELILRVVPDLPEDTHRDERDLQEGQAGESSIR